MAVAFDDRRRRARLPAWSAALAAAFVVTAAYGEEAPKDAPKKAAEARASSGHVDLNEVEIHGEIEKPKIFFILPKAKQEAETRQRRIRFYPDILEPLEKDRFEEEARVLYQHGIPAE
jgi:hypothetical protein